jgi:hypothetical protein
MSERLKYGIVALLVVGALTVTAVGVLAQQEQPEQQQPPTGVKPMRGPGVGMCGEAGLNAAADALHMTADELQNQLWAGSTLADLADQANVDLQTLRGAVEEACTQARHDAIQSAIEAAVENGSITQDHADWLLQGLNQGYLDGPGFGHGFGLGRGFGWRGGHEFGGFGRRFEFRVAPGSFSGRSGPGLRFAPQRPSAPATTGSTT